MALVLLLLISVQCAQVRRLTYPPDFKYIESSQVRTTMGKMAQLVLHLQGLVQSGDFTAAAKQEQVQATLLSLERLMLSLQGPTNHPYIDEHRDAFLHAVQAAENTVMQPQPDYNLAAGISQQCASCHRFIPK